MRLCAKCRGFKVIWTFRENAPKTGIIIFNRRIDEATGREKVQILCTACGGTGDGA